MDIKVVTTFFRGTDTINSAQRDNKNKKNTDYHKNIHFHLYAASPIPCGLESLHRTFISTACTEEHTDLHGFIYHTKL